MIDIRMKTSKILSIKFLIILFALLAVKCSDKEVSDVDKSNQVMEIREGLPNFFEKSLRGDSIQVAYLGGSITAQEGWRVYSLKWFQQRFSKAVFSEINAAIGGTGSDFGVFRLKEHVLKFNPDLVFVEFAVNDGNTPSEKIVRSMEGIVRQIWEHNSGTDICFIYTFKEGFLENFQNGQLPNSVLAMEKVADRYKIPTINFGLEVSALVSDSQLIVKDTSEELNGVMVFSSDGVHPYIQTGHAIYQEVLERSFETMVGGKMKQAKKHEFSKPLAADYFSNTQMIDFTEAKLSENWEVFNLEDRPEFLVFNRFLHKVGKGGQSGESLSIRFKGQAIGAYDIMGPDAGKVIVEIDGSVIDTISRFDKYCTYRRLSYFLIDHLEDRDHEVVFKVLSDPFDKAAILKKRGSTMGNPDDYKENNWYIGKILVDGILKSSVL